MINNEIPVVTQFGEGVIETITISELKQLIIRVRYDDIWVNHPIGNIEEALNLKEIKFKDEKKIDTQGVRIGTVC